MFIANLRYKKSIKVVNEFLEDHLKYLDKYFSKGNFYAVEKNIFQNQVEWFYSIQIIYKKQKKFYLKIRSILKK